MTKMCTYFKTKADVTQYLINKFFSNFACHRPFHRKYFKRKKYGGMGLNSEKMEALYVEVNERVEAVTSSYFAPGDFSQHTYSVFVAKNKKKT